MKRFLLLISVFFVSTSELFAKGRGFEHVQQSDPKGLIVTLVCITVVFCSLVLLFALFALQGKLMIKLSANKQKKHHKSSTSDQKGVITGEELAAIATAMKLYRGTRHDRESEIITINKVARSYSPWSSKIHGLRQMPNYKK